MIDKKLLDILACPKCKGDILLTEKGFICINCKLLFRIKDNIPNFVIDEAEKLDNNEIKKYISEKS